MYIYIFRVRFHVYIAKRIYKQCCQIFDQIVDAEARASNFSKHLYYNNKVARYDMNKRELRAFYINESC